MNKRIKLIMMLMTFLLLTGLVTGVEYYYNDDVFVIESYTIWDSDLLNTIRQMEGVAYVYDYPYATIIGVELDNVNVDSDEIIDYVNSLDGKFEDNKNNVITFPGYDIPVCYWDYGTSQPIGVYWYNSEQVTIQNDPKC